MLDGTIRMVPQIINTVLFAAVISRREHWWDGDGPIPERGRSTRSPASSRSAAG